MTIYAMKQKMKTELMIHYTHLQKLAQETLNGQKVRLTFNTGFVNGNEYYYEFIYRGSVEGTLHIK